MWLYGEDKEGNGTCPDGGHRADHGSGDPEQALQRAA